MKLYSRKATGLLKDRKTVLYVVKTSQKQIKRVIGLSVSDARVSFTNLPHHMLMYFIDVVMLFQKYKHINI